jgi:hypothetical protein
LFHIPRKTKENRHVFDFEPFPMSEIGGGIGVRFHDRTLPRSEFQHLKRLETPSPDLTRSDPGPVLHRKDNTVITLQLRLKMKPGNRTILQPKLVAPEP